MSFILLHVTEYFDSWKSGILGNIGPTVRTSSMFKVSRAPLSTASRQNFDIADT